MKKITLMEKYPVFILKIEKHETSFKNAAEILEYFKDLIKKHPVASFIADFNHYEHTNSLQDSIISPDIIDARNIIFCFGKQLPNAHILAVRPRTIGICEFKESFEINFLEVPNEQLHNVVEEWAKSVQNK